MMLKLALWVGMMSVAAAVSAEEKPAAYHVSPMIQKDVDPVPGFMAVSTEATISGMEDALNDSFMPLVTAAQEAGVHFMGGPIFIYDGAMGDPDQPFTLTTGFPVAPGTEAVDGAVIEELPEARVASVYYTGPIEHLKEAYEALFPALFAAGLRPSGVSREVYLHWVDEDSPNNIIEVQAVLAE